MPRNITDAQNRVRDFHRSDALAQTNQIKYDCFFMYGTENIKKTIFSRSKMRNKKTRAPFFRFYIVL